MRFYSIDATIHDDGNAVLEFNKSSEDGIKSRLTDTFVNTSTEGIAEALRNLADYLDGGLVEFFEDDSDDSHDPDLAEEA